MPDGGEHWWQATCPGPSVPHTRRALERQGQLTKPAGSLGRIEELAVELAGLQATDLPSAARAPIIIFAGDHGITAQGVSAFPSAVTVEMVRNFARGGAAIAVLARELDCPLAIVDAGTLAPASICDGVVVDKPRLGTRDFSLARAMTGDEAQFALAAGSRAVARAPGCDVLLLGEMGIGNTSAATAIVAALTGTSAVKVAGRGTGIDDAGLAHKAGVIAMALERHGLDKGPADALDTLEAVGGLEIAALAGAIVAAAQRGMPVLVDGFIVSAAALVAVRLNASCRAWLMFSHRSAEQGHRIVLDALAARPILDLELRLGEGSGAALALPMLRLACVLHNGMATFTEAAVSGRSAP